MRLDDRSHELALTADQRFFASCWFNMVHAQSLDSYRVRTMNPRNIVKELQKILQVPHANEADREMVLAEALIVLRGDPVLRRPKLQSTASTLIRLLAQDKQKKLASTSLISHFSRELLQQMEQHYLSEALDGLGGVLLVDPPPFTSEARRELLKGITSNLLSVLLDGGACIESLFQLYWQVIVPRRGGAYEFARKFELLRKLLLQPQKEFRILFCVDNISDVDEFPEAAGSVTFSPQGTGWVANQQPEAGFLAANPRRLFAEVSVQAQDIRTAGAMGYSLVNSVLDLVRFEYERERISLSQEFIALEVAKPGRPRRYPIPRVVPNPSTTLTTTDPQLFVSSVNELISSPSFSVEGRDRVLSAFRLYRLGADAESFENKLTNWWTAIEYLVRGLKGGNQIGTAVEQNATPLLCLSYVGVLLLDMRSTLRHMQVQITDPVTNTPIPYPELGPADLFRTFTRSDVTPVIAAALAREPYVQDRLIALLAKLADPAACRAMLADHEQRVRWQIQRIWRARCDILHSAKRAVQDALLCANLEFYLKSTLMALLVDLRKVQTLSGPEEFFERKRYAYQVLEGELANKSLDGLVRVLESELQP